MKFIPCDNSRRDAPRARILRVAENAYVDEKARGFSAATQERTSSLRKLRQRDKTRQGRGEERRIDSTERIRGYYGMHERTLGKPLSLGASCTYREREAQPYTRNCRTYDTVSNVTCRQSTAIAVVYERERLLESSPRSSSFLYGIIIIRTVLYFIS